MANRFSVRKNGFPLDPRLYTWDEETKTFSTNEDGLVLNFMNWEGVTFRAGYFCTFITGDNCTFVTNSNCTFKTGRNCNFHTTGGCHFITGCDCTFDANRECVFIVGSGCVFKNITSQCVLVRRDVDETYTLPIGESIKLNGFGNCGYEIIPKKETKEELLAKIVQKLNSCDVEKLKKFLELES